MAIFISFQEVHIVCYDQSSFNKIKSHLFGKKSSSRNCSVESRQKTNTNRGKNVNESYSIKFRIVGRGKENVVKAKSEFQRFLNQEYTEKEMDKLTSLKWSDIKNLRNNCVKLELNEKKGILKLSGLKTYVESTEVEVNKIYIERQKQIMADDSCSWDELETFSGKREDYLKVSLI